MTGPAPKTSPAAPPAAIPVGQSPVPPHGPRYDRPPGCTPKHSPLPPLQPAHAVQHLRSVRFDSVHFSEPPDCSTEGSSSAPSQGPSADGRVYYTMHGESKPASAQDKGSTAAAAGHTRVAEPASTLSQPGMRRKYTLSALPLDERRASAAHCIQEFWASRRAEQHHEDERAWAAFVALDDAHEALTVQRIERRRKLRELIHQKGGPPRATYEKLMPRSLPSLTNASLEALISGMRQGATIGSMVDAMQIVKAASLCLEAEPAVPRVEAASPDGRLVVVGDIHGNLDDLLYILDNQGMPGPMNKYIFNGDLVDRGPMSCEVLLLVFALKLSAPEAVTIIRGNHEDRDVNVFCGFLDECLEKFDNTFFEMCQEAFDWLPIACIIAPTPCCSVLVIHGGLPMDASITVADLADAGRGPEVWRRQSERIRNAVMDIAWSDPGPSSMQGRKANVRRGRGALWGKQATRDFLKENGLSFMIRSHEAVKKGYRSDHGGLCHTVFSASDYTGGGNRAAVVIFTQGKTEFDVCSWELIDSELPSDLRGRKGRHKADPVSLLVGYLCDYVADNRAALEAYWAAVDAAGTGMVKFDDFVAGLRAELHIACEPVVLTNRTLLPPKCRVKRDWVKYREFLDYHEPQLHAASCRLQQWHESVIAELRAKLSQSRMGLEQVFKAFDKDGDGVLRYSEFKAAMRRVLPLDVLSDSQLESLAAAFDLDGDGTIDAGEFCERLRSVDAAQPAANGSAADSNGGRFVRLEWARDGRTERLSALAAQIGTRRASAAGGGRRGSTAVRSLEDQLRQFDQDHDDKVSRAELAAALSSLGLGADDQVLDDIFGVAAPVESMLLRTRRASAHLGVDKVALTGREYRGSWWKGATFFHILVTLVGGATYNVDRRYREFDALCQRVASCVAKAGLPPFPSKTWTRPSGGALDARQRGLGQWLAAVVKEAGVAGAPPRLVQAVRRFLGADSPANPRAERKCDDADALPISAVAHALAAPDTAGAIEGVGRQMLGLLYRYRSELADLPGIGLQPDAAGMVPVPQLREALSALNEVEGTQLTRAQIESLLGALDSDNDGLVSANDLLVAPAAEPASGGPLVRRASFAPQTAAQFRQAAAASSQGNITPKSSGPRAFRAPRSPVTPGTQSLRRQTFAPASQKMKMRSVHDNRVPSLATQAPQGLRSPGPGGDSAFGVRTQSTFAPRPTAATAEDSHAADLQLGSESDEAGASRATLPAPAPAPRN
eukprot:TRINITY_DN3198_c0_g1_i2.p1 TRINITY_DN3198_c0_g1~~TRINITY_DN3198_c0_g1_i2.p1  ORF type:complete len:1264 (+),score=391.28 TRINITY_DN3198_c0_g1_i2:86-3793(+)